MGRFEKGKTGNPEGRPKKVTAGETLVLGYSGSATVPDLPKEKKEGTIDFQTGDWQPFGSDNLFPNVVSDLSRKATSHRGILNWKTIYTTGKGFTTEDKKLDTYIKAVNKAESLKKVTRKLIYDRLMSGNGYLELVKGTGFLNMYHKDTTTCRVSKDGTKIKIFGNWKEAESNQAKIKTIPTYPEFAMVDGQMRSIYHFKSYEPEYRFYGVPDWIAGMDAAGIAYKTNKWNLSRLDNSFQSSGVFLVEGNLSPKDAKELKEQFKKEYTGEKKQGKILFMVKALGGGNTTFTPFTNLNEGDWLQLHKQSDQDLIVSHNWFPSLFGSGASSSWNMQQVRTEYQIAKGTVIADEQDFFLEIFKKIINEQLKLNTDTLAFINESPISIADLLDPKQVLTVNEQRKLFGFEEVDEKIMATLGKQPAFKITQE